MQTLKLLLAFVILTLTLGSGVGAATTSTPSATPDVKQKQIDDLKERLATKVAELKATQRRAIAGSVKSKSISTIMVETQTRDAKIELTDDIKVIQYLKGNRTKLTLDDLEKGDNVVVFGEYDTTLDLMRAKVIFIQSPSPLYVSGSVTEVNKNDFSLTLSTFAGRGVIVDIEKSTKTILWSRSAGLTKGGFSKINVGDTVHIVGTPLPKKENRVSAGRILNLGNLTGTPTPAPTEEVKASPSATPKATPKTSPTPTPKS